MKHQQEFLARREQLLQQMEDDSVAILFTAPHYHRSADQDHCFYPDHDFYYFTGFAEPQAAAVLIKSKREGSRYILFNRHRDPLQEQWAGRRVGQEKAVTLYGVDEAYTFDELAEKLPQLLTDKSCLYYIWGRYADCDQRIRDAINTIRRKVRAGEKIPDTLINLENIVHEMRLIKSPYEIEMIRKAVDISVDAHKRVMKMCRPGLNEYHIRAELIYEFQRQGCRDEAYETIVAGGENACILHYIEASQDLHDKELLLVDAGGCFNYYNADITRTFPINGKFSPEQKAIYNIVLHAQQKALEGIAPGQSWNTMSDAATRAITEGLVSLGLLKGNVDELIKSQAYTPFYMHRIGHWLGMDVHDVGRYKVDGQWRALEAGMVTTIEPGIYIKPGMDVDKKWWGIGVRIEDNVLVTPTGYEVLSANLPKQAEEIESFMAQAQ